MQLAGFGIWELISPLELQKLPAFLSTNLPRSPHLEDVSWKKIRTAMRRSFQNSGGPIMSENFRFRLTR